MSNSHTNRQHTVDSLFTLSLLGVFAISALLITVFGANTYEKIVSDSRKTYECATALSYIREKIRQNDSANCISVATVENTDVLSLKSRVNDKSYTTYVYYQDGALRELYQQEGYDLPLSVGQSILKVHGLSMEQLSDTLFRFTATDEDGSESEITVAINSAVNQEAP